MSLDDYRSIDEKTFLSSTAASVANDANNQATAEELEWARAIKRAACRDPSVNHSKICDWEYLQHAIIAQNNVKKALARIKKLQKFKDRYGIKLDGSFEEGVRDLEACLLRNKGFLLACGALQDNTHVMCTDYNKLLPGKYNSEEGFAILLRSGFYCLQISQPNIASMRAGYICLLDLKGIGLMNVSMKLEERFAELYAGSYPINVRKICMMNADFFMRVFNSLLRVFTPKKVFETRVMVGKSELFLRSSPEYTRDILPRAWGGTQDPDDFLKIAVQKLEERYALAAAFRL